ncbi:MAG: hypothetical protein K1060chlam5_00699 [Candidatus Anoxychlamydiales bacterium]|nr:hypothetical protein [Candidatus Anoxychlamydiales bacterium]
MSDGSSSIPPQGDKPIDPSHMQPIEPPKKKPITPIDEGEKKFLGMNFTKMQYAKFLSNLINTMLQQMKKENERMMAALRKLRDGND